MFETVAFRIIIWLPLNDKQVIPSTFLSKKEKKKKKEKKAKKNQTCTNMYFFFPEGSRYTRKCSMYILHYRGMKNMCKKATMIEAYRLIQLFN